MQTRLDIAGVRTTAAPLITATAKALYTAVSHGGKTLIPIKPTSLSNVGLRHMSQASILKINKSIGIVNSYQLLNLPVLLELMIRRGGRRPIQRAVYLEAVYTAPQGSLSINVGGMNVDLVRGPVRLLSGGEAREKFGSVHKDAYSFDPKKDRVLLGMTIEGTEVDVSTITRTTLNEAGHVVDSVVRRRRRTIEL